MTLPDDPINHPAHYTFSRIEPIDAIEAWELGFHLGNAVKYITRAGRKGDKLQDLRKARWYLEREIERLAREQFPIVHVGTRIESRTTGN